MIDLFIYRAPEETEALKKAQLEARPTQHFEDSYRPSEQAPPAEAAESWGEGGWGETSTPWGESTTSQWGDSEAPAVASTPVVAAPPVAAEPAGWESNTLLNNQGWD